MLGFSKHKFYKEYFYINLPCFLNDFIFDIIYKWKT